jgi:hypothetical protein
MPKCLLSQTLQAWRHALYSTLMYSTVGPADIVQLELCDVRYPLALSQARSYFVQLAHLNLLSCKPETVRAWQIALCTANTLFRTLETNIPRNETARPRSQFLHLCISERFIYYQVRSDYFAAARWSDRGNKYINKDTCMRKLGTRPRSFISGNTSIGSCL